MGRIDVRLEMGRDGTLNAHLSVDRPETFDALNRDARQLERMLQQSGMKLDGSSIQFSLRDGGAGGGHERGGGQDNAPLASAHRIDEDIPNPAPVYARVPSSALLDMEV